MAQFVRWLGAYCSNERRKEIYQSAGWEVSQREREVAVEPLFRGRSLILREMKNVHVGLVPDMDKTQFGVGYLCDANTKVGADGVLTARRNTKGSIRDKDRFLALWSKANPKHHGECVMDFFRASAVAVRANAPADALGMAQDLADSLGLPVVVIQQA